MRRFGRAMFIAIAVFIAGLLPAVQAQGPDNFEAANAGVLETDSINPGQATATFAVRAKATTETVTLPLPVGCDTRTSAIGLSRIVEIDATGGPRFGHSQYKDIDFLQDGEVVLTFDDGPIRRYTKPILDALDSHCTRATFFSVGRMAVADPETLKETARRGHTIASHTWSHARLSGLSAAKAKFEIELGNSAVTKALGAPIAPFFRFPYLRDSRSALDYLRSRNMSTFSIEVDSQDFRTRNPGQVLRNVMAQLKSVKKGIILFHDIQPATAGALSSLLDSLKAGGFKIVHLVSKTQNTTLPEFDAMVDRELERKRLALAGKPLADRAITWSNAGGSPEQPDAAKVSATQGLPKGKSIKAGQPAATSASKNGPPETAGPSENDVGLPPELPAPKRPVRKPLWQGLDDSDPWRIRTLGD